jgi:hypothetical protein
MKNGYCGRVMLWVPVVLCLAPSGCGGSSGEVDWSDATGVHYGRTAEEFCDEECSEDALKPEEPIDEEISTDPSGLTGCTTPDCHDLK